MANRESTGLAPSTAATKIWQLWRDPNVRFTIVAALTVASGWWFFSSVRGGFIVRGSTFPERLWAVRAVLFRSLLSLSFAFWLVKLLFADLLVFGKLPQPTAVEAETASRDSGKQTCGTRGATWAASWFFGVIILSFLLRRWLRYAGVAVNPWLCWGIETALVAGGCFALVAYSRRGNSSVPARNRSLNATTTTVAVLALLASTIYFCGTGAILLPAAVLVIGYIFSGPQMLARWAVAAARRGDYETALGRVRLCVWPRNLGLFVRADILYDMGRYREVKELMKPRAFDFAGNFQLGRLELLLYAMAEMQEGNLAEAERILRAAVGAPQRTGAWQFCLAEVLLMQGKDVDTACELIEFIRANWRLNGPRPARDSIAAKITALHAWALALKGNRAEAEREIELLLANLPQKSERDVAKVQIYIGEAQMALGKAAPAREAFTAAAMLDPHGGNGRRARDFAS